MQWKSEKSQKLLNKLGQLIRKKRLDITGKSLNMFSYEFDLNPGNICKIETGKIEPKFVMLWRIAEALSIPLSELIRELENEIDFNLIEK
ncbi:helix-turn-helix transcriptional regulator [bacterium]|nr:helix-turn-helix transcriptional regulator [bacterium]